MALEGQQLGRYQIVRLLGSGGMGDVYLAEDPRIGQQVAIKVFRAEPGPYPAASGTQTAARLFQREARAIVALDHPHILPLNDYGEEPQGKTSLLYLVMPYRPEGSLVDWIGQHYPAQLVPPALLAHLIGQAAEALQHAHDHQIIHQDVKPSNFLIRANPKDPARPDLLLADFGIAHLAGATSNTSQAIRGTPTYMAPEQCMGQPVTASDQYALAIMAYELLTGRAPFQGNQMQMMFQHVHQPPEPPSAINPRLPGAIDEVILIALAKRPEERFASVTAFANAFQSAAQEMALAQADTRISETPLPRITRILPDTSLISETLANAPTQITPLTDEVALTTPAPATDPGGGYSLVGQIKTAVTNATVGDQNTVALTVSAQGLWVYQFTDAQKQALARLIAGKGMEEAQRLLASQPGVARASITLSGGIGQTLPSDPAKIKIVVQAPGA
jgi:serine/threonine protein kinase